MKTIRVIILIVFAGVATLMISRYQLAVERQKLEARPQARLLLALQETNTGVIEVDPQDQRIVYANEAATRIFDYEDGRLVGLPLAELLPEWMREAHRLRLEQTEIHMRSSGKPISVFTAKCQGLQRNGGTVDIFVRVYAGRSSGLFAMVNLAEETRYIDKVPVAAPADLKK